MWRSGELAPSLTAGSPGSTVELTLVAGEWVSQTRGLNMGELAQPVICCGVVQAQR